MTDSFRLRQPHEAVIERFDWGELRWYANGAMGNAAGVAVGRCVLRPGCANPMHYHPNCEEVLFVLEGRIEHYVEGPGWMTMEPGSTITIAPNVRHGARNVGDVDAHLMICFSSAERQTVGEEVGTAP